MNTPLLRHIDSLILSYSYFDTYSELYDVNLKHIADWDLYKLAGMIIEEDTSRGAEATGCDNPHYETMMLPALTDFMKRPFSKEARCDFNEKWQKGIYLYLQTYIEKLFEERLELFNEQKKDEEKWVA